MFALLLRDSIHKKVMSVLNKYSKPFSRIEVKDEIIQEDIENGVKFEFFFNIYSYNIKEIVEFFNKYFYASSKNDHIHVSATTNGEVISLNTYVIIDRDMIDSLL